MNDPHTRFKYFNYLKQTGVWDVLQESMRESALQRPVDPVGFIAAYLQERAHLYENAGVLDPEEKKKLVESHLVTVDEPKPAEAAQVAQVPNQTQQTAPKAEEDNEEDGDFDTG